MEMFKTYYIFAKLNSLKLKVTSMKSHNDRSILGIERYLQCLKGFDVKKLHKAIITMKCFDSSTFL